MITDPMITDPMTADAPVTDTMLADSAALGAALAELRQKKGISQSDLAEVLDVSRQAVSRWEQGTARPSSDNLARLSSYFDVPVDRLLHPGQAVPREAPPEAAPGEVPEEEPEAISFSFSIPIPAWARRVFTWKRVALCAIALLAALLLWLAADKFLPERIPYLEEWEQDYLDLTSAQYFKGEY